MVAILLSACGGGGGGYTPTCVDNGRGCSPHIPTDGRGDSASRTPSDDRGEVPHTPENDRGDNSERNPAGGSGRGNDTNYEPVDGRGNNTERIPNDNRDDKSGYAPKENTGGRPSRRFSSLRYLDKITIDEVREYNSLGKELGLSYSNFGTYKINNPNTDGSQSNMDEKIPFIDINIANKIETSNIATNVNFSGRAVGQASSDSDVVNLDGKAILSFDATTGVSRLGATFSNWYDINVQNDDVGTIVFSDYKNKNGLVKIEIQPDLNGNIVASGANIEINYYAPKPENGIPTEANGLLQFQEPETGIKLDVAFGVK